MDRDENESVFRLGKVNGIFEDLLSDFVKVDGSAHCGNHGPEVVADVTEPSAS